MLTIRLVFGAKPIKQICGLNANFWERNNTLVYNRVVCYVNLVLRHQRSRENNR